MVLRILELSISWGERLLLIMNEKQCKYCGGELEEGTFYGAGSFFVPKGKKIPATYMKRSFDKQGAIRIPPFYFPLFAPKENPLAYACRNCKTIMIFYEVNEEE